MEITIRNITIDNSSGVTKLYASKENNQLLFETVHDDDNSYLYVLCKDNSKIKEVCKEQNDIVFKFDGKYSTSNLIKIIENEFNFVIHQMYNNVPNNLTNETIITIFFRYNNNNVKEYYLLKPNSNIQQVINALNSNTWNSYFDLIS